MKKLKKSAEFTLSAGEEGVIEGYASVFGGVDYYGDTIEPTAYDKVVSAKQMPAMLFGHNSYSVPIGKWLEMSVDDKGLKVKGQLNLENTRGKEVYDAIKFGALSGLSVSFSVDEDGYEFKDKKDPWAGMNIKSISRLYEISVVSLPADDSARIDSVKSVDFEAIQSIKDLEDSLRDVGCTRAMAKGFISTAKRVLANQRDAEKQVDNNAENEVSARLQSILNKFN